MARKDKLRLRQDGETKEVEEVAKRVVLDYATVKTAVQTIREFEKEYGISMLDRKGLEQASAILKKYEQQDKLQRFVEEKITEQIAPLDKKISSLMNMMHSLINENTPTGQEQEQNPLRDAPEYVKKNIGQSQQTHQTHQP